MVINVTDKIRPCLSTWDLKGICVHNVPVRVSAHVISASSVHPHPQSLCGNMSLKRQHNKIDILFSNT